MDHTSMLALFTLLNATNLDHFVGTKPLSYYNLMKARLHGYRWSFARVYIDNLCCWRKAHLKWTTHKFIEGCFCNVVGWELHLCAPISSPPLKFMITIIYFPHGIPTQLVLSRGRKSGFSIFGFMHEFWTIPTVNIWRTLDRKNVLIWWLADMEYKHSKLWLLLLLLFLFLLNVLTPRVHIPSRFLDTWLFINILNFS